MFERILVPLDGSPTAAKALEQAEALGEKLGSTLILVRIVHTLGDLASAATPSLTSQAATSQDVIARSDSASEHAESRTYISNLSDALRKRGLGVETHIGEGVPADEIMKTALSANASLIVMTAYGAGGAHTRAEKAVFGGVADEVLRQSRVPVLLVRP
ncbi:MAG TPA: universal stress protein [Dehalococcoidia bacterium]|nr:universal stress protein [Dehalococcoidia bacterium]